MALEKNVKSVLLLHGPNLQLLGSREPEIYGTATLLDHVATVRAAVEKLGWVLADVQSNSEAELVAAIHDARQNHAAIIINPGAFTHYSWAIHDALSAYSGPIVEVHLSQPLRRESWRHVSVVAPLAIGTIAGFGAAGYELAVAGLTQYFQSQN
jgi:3-dehydroquinate dehydratase II